MKRNGKYFLMLLMAAAWICISSCGRSTDFQASAEPEDPPVVETDFNETKAEEPDTWFYRIDELGVELELPSSLYVYRTDGIRWDWNREWFRFSGSQLIVIADKEYPEAFWDELTIADLQQAAGDIVFTLTLTPREWSPVSRLCENLFVGTEEIRVTEDWYCETVIPSGLHMDDYSVYAGPEEESSLTGYAMWAEGWQDAIQNHTQGTMSLNDQAEQLLTLQATEYGTTTTMVNEDWWNAYCQAVDELTAHPEKYVYEDDAVQSALSEVRDRYEAYYQNGASQLLLDQDDYMTDVYTDQSEDIYLRAYCYAVSAVLCDGTDEEPAGLEEILIIFQDWHNSQRSCTAFFPGGSLSSSDFMVDLTAAHAYLFP